MKKTYLILVIILTFSISSMAQVRTNNAVSPSISSNSPFLDASGNLFTTSTNNGKGLVFPRTNLSTFTFNPSSGSPANYKTGFDSMIVYNTITGSTPATGSGIGNQDVTPGFYYFSNPTSTNGATLNGEWIRLDGGSSRTEVNNNTINETTTIINGVPEKVVLVDGVANGTTTELTLDAAVLSSGDVTQLREAKIYQGTRLLMVASGDYDSAGNVLVTGDGMVNKLLPAGTYTVELYYE